MMAAEGSWPNSQAGNAIEVKSDLRLRGGMLMMRRRILPSYTSCSFAATSARCQFDRNGAPELSSAKQRLMKVWKSPRKAARYSSMEIAGAGFSIIGASIGRRATVRPKEQERAP